MKKIISLMAIVLMAFATSCSKENEYASFKAKVSTGDVSDVSYNYFTLHSDVEWYCDENCFGEAGFFVGKTGDVSADHCLCTTSPVSLGKKFKQEDYTYQFKNLIGLDIIGIHLFESGETCYYRAYIHAVDAEGSHYIYGDIKSFRVQ